VSFIIQSIQDLSKSKASRREHMYFQLILSKYFERSSLISILGVQVDLSELITLCAKMTLSIIWHPSTYLDCSLGMMKGKTGLSLSAMIFVMIL